MPKSKHKTKSSKRKPSRLPKVLIIAGLFLLVIVILLVKEKPNETITSNELPEIQLNRALEAGQPTLAFFHSNNCDQCIDMIRIVDQVFPEFSESIVLVDVNVYDKQNEPLLRRASIQYIPTLIFINRSGRGTVTVGVLQADILRNQLLELMGEE